VIGCEPQARTPAITTKNSCEQRSGSQSKKLAYLVSQVPFSIELARIMPENTLISKIAHFLFELELLVE
jgi:hypothetical protein